MDSELVHAAINDNKISSFASALMEIFNFLYWCETFGPPATLDIDQTYIRVVFQWKAKTKCICTFCLYR
jgi:hypothetical protein